MDSKDKDVKLFEKKDFANGETPPKPHRIRWKNTNLISSLEFALSGIWTACKEERNMRKHILTSIFILLMGVFFRVSTTDWLFLALAIFLVITTELINSAIENVVDLAADYQFHLRAKKAKDMAAGAVLMISGFAVVVGIIVFLPRIWSLIFG